MVTRLSLAIIAIRGNGIDSGATSGDLKSSATLVETPSNGTFEMLTF